MRLAYFTDVHADVHTLRAALRQIDGLSCDRIVCGGDLVDYGLFPEETIALLRERGVPCVRGNHDRWALQDFSLSPGDRGWLASLPKSWSHVENGLRIVVCHGSPRADMDGIVPGETEWSEARLMLQRAEADVLLVGHTHRRFVWHFPGGGMIVNPGALLADPVHAVGPEPGGHFGIFDSVGRTFTVYRALDGQPVECPAIQQVPLAQGTPWRGRGLSLE